MNLTQNPFSIYDFLGYMIPGIYLAISVYFVSIFPFSPLKVDLLIFANLQTSIILLLFCYLVGHLTSFVSSVTVEKYSIWTLGYPSTYLFEEPREGYWKSIFHKNEGTKYRIGPILRIAFRIGIKALIFVVLLPATLMDIAVRHLFRLRDQYARPFEKDLLQIVRPRIDNLVQTRFAPPDQVIVSHKNSDKRDYFRVIYHWAIENSKNHQQKFQNYVAIYGFLRTTTLISVISTWLVLFRLIEKEQINEFGYVVPVLMFVSFTLYLSFNKFFRKFSMEVYLAAVAASTSGSDDQRQQK